MNDIVEEANKSKNPIATDTAVNGHVIENEKDGLREREPKKRSLKDRLTGKGKEPEYEANGKDKPRFTVGNQIRATLFSSWLNILLIFSPVGIAVNYAGIDPVAIFVINFICHYSPRRYVELCD